MDKDTIRILLVEDNPGDACLLREMFNEKAPRKYELTHHDSMAKAVAHLGANKPMAAATLTQLLERTAAEPAA